MSASEPIPHGRSLLRFVLASCLAFVASFGITILLHEVCGTSAELAYGVALVTVFLLSFALLRWWIYGRRTGPIVPQFLAYVVSALVFRGTEYVAFLGLHTWCGVQYVITMLLIQTTSLVAKFLYYGTVIFRRQTADGERAASDRAAGKCGPEEG